MRSSRPSTPSPRPAPHRRTAGFTGLQALGIVLAVVLVTAGITFWVARTYLWPADFEPVLLSAREQTRLDSKLRALGIDPPPPPAVSARGDRIDGGGRDGTSVLSRVSRRDESAEPSLRERATDAKESAAEWLRPEPYSEDPSKREIGISERELNSLLAHNTDLARRLAIDLSDDLASARLLVPIDPDFPIMGGRTLRVAAGLELKYGSGRPVVIVRGVSLMGVPIPNAWLGGLKNVDLVREFGGGPGVWQTFADGVDFVEIRDGELQIKLKE